MEKSYKPAGYTSVAPYLIVNGAGETIAFLEKVFGAQRLRIFTSPDGRYVHAEVRVDDTVIMFADGEAALSPVVPAHVHIYVPDVDATFRKAMEAGATSIQEPTKKDDPDRRGGFRDTGGTTWWVGTQVSCSTQMMTRCARNARRTNQSFCHA
jgi:PhnB protein